MRADMNTAPSLTSSPDDASPLTQVIAQRIADAGGWIGFDTLMELALYAPGLGYYTSGATVFGQMPQGLRDAQGNVHGAGSDFVTAPEITPLFGQALANQVREALDATGTDEIWEFGAGSGALACQLLDALGARVTRYTIVDLSLPLRARQRESVAAHAHKVRWLDSLPAQFQGVVVGNEVLDAMPVKLLARVGGVWHERGVVTSGTGLAWADRVTDLRPPLEIEGTHDYLSEIHLQGEAFVRTLADRLQAGAVFLLDYGFPEAEYYHPQRHMGTLMCHRAHLADTDPLQHLGHKDITAHVNFTGIAVAAQEAGLEVLGYSSQAHFLINCGLVDALEGQALAQRVAAQKLLLEHEMGEFFKVIGLGKGPYWDARGFAKGDRTHRL